MKYCLALLGLLASSSASSAFAGPRVDILVGAEAPQLERFAADELKDQLRRLFDADARVASAPGAELQQTILVGSPKTNPAIRELGGFPDLSDQGHVLRSVRYKDRPALLVGGGSPVATLWAVYEYGQRLGIRSFLFGDLYPVAKPDFTLAGFDLVLEPKLKLRAWQLDGDSPLGSAMWGVEEIRQALRQLAKLKFNAIVIPGEPLPMSLEIAVDGDTAGRGAFRGAKLFENPDYAGMQGDERRKAASNRLSTIAEAAQSLGLKVTVAPGLLPETPKPKEDAAAQIGVLPAAPHARLSLSSLTERQGITLPPAQLGDQDLAAYYISRVSFGETLTPEQACHDLLTPVCGDEVSSRVWKAFQYLAQASTLLARNDASLAWPDPQMVLKHQINEPAPEWWTEAKDAYLNAMNEMYRANTRAREGGRAYTLYFARRSEFGMHYFNCLLAVRKAGIARGKQDDDARASEMEAAVESIYAAAGALAAVARSSSDRATIAVVNKHVYRPLKRELEAAGN